MVETRNQKRKNSVTDHNEYLDDENIKCQIKKKIKPSVYTDLYPEETILEDPDYNEFSEGEFSEGEISEGEFSEGEISEGEFSEDKISESEFSEEEEFCYELEGDSDVASDPEDIEGLSIDNKQIQKIIKTSIKNIVKKYVRKEESSEFCQFNDIIDSIYGGEFFERVPIEDRKDKLKEKYSKEQIQEMTKQLELIKDNYHNSSPSVIDILRMDVSMEQKQKLLEKIYSFANSEVLTQEYNSNLKFLTSKISTTIDPELLELERKILESNVNKDDSYRIKILKSKMSFENKVVAYKKLEIMQTYEDTDASEYAKYKSWMDALLSVPFGIYNDSGVTLSSNLDDIKNYIKNVRNTLDNKLSFLEKPKDQIINVVTQMIRNPNVNINAIGLCGEPGTGKSEIIASIAKALDRPYRMISLGGESDSSGLTGHGFTYVGSNPGALIDVMRNTKIMNPIILFDELDKVSETQHGKEIIGTLIHLTDTTTNNKYNLDKYFSGIDFDLSKVLFIFTYNDKTKIDRILADRLFKINVDNYSFKEKLEITNKHIITSMLEKFKFNINDISFEEDAIKHLVNGNKSYGMRNIKTKLEIIFSRINTLLLTNEGDTIINLKYKQLYKHYKTLPVIIPQKHIDIFLDESISTEMKGSEPPLHMYI